MLNEIEKNQISDTEFKAMVIRKHTELMENYQKPQGNKNELTANYINRKNDIETINKDEAEMKKTISEMKNTLKESEADFMNQRILSVRWRAKQKKKPERAKKRFRRMKRG